MKPVLAVIAAVGLLLGPSAQPAAARPADGSVTSLSIVPSSGKAEVVIGVKGGVEVRDFTLRSPDRIVLAAPLGLVRPERREPAHHQDATDRLRPSRERRVLHLLIERATRRLPLLDHAP